MAIRVVPYEATHEPLVQAFNLRLAAGGSDWRFYEKALPKWLPPGANDEVERRFYLALDDEGVVRGGFALKPQGFLLKGEKVRLASIQGPVSEGLVDSRFGLVAMVMVRHMYSVTPLLFGWGGGERIHALLKGLGWTAHRTPLLARVLNPGRFLRQAPMVRKNARVARVLDIAAATGLGGLGVGLLHFLQRARSGGLLAPSRRAEPVERFGDWADELWRQGAGSSDLLALRDAATMNALLPPSGWPDAQILKVGGREGPVGWAAVKIRQLEEDSRFGNLRLGSIIDAMAAPGAEREVIAAATRRLREDGADVAISNFSHQAWIDASKACGYLARSNQRTYSVSPALSDLVASRGVDLARLHLTLLDGDGPHGY